MNMPAQVAAALAAAIALMGCERPYAVDVCRDVLDIFTVAVGVGAGAKVRVGPIAPAFIVNSNVVGLVGGDTFCEMGEEPVHGGDLSPLIPYLLFACDKGNNGSRLAVNRDKAYEGLYFLVFPMPGEFESINPHYPASYLTQIEATGGLGLTLKLGFNPGELLDFVLCLFSVDIYGDDLEAAKWRWWQDHKPSAGQEAPTPR